MNQYRGRIAASVIVALAASISVCSTLAQPPSHRKEPDPLHLTKKDKKWVAATLRSLSLEEKVGQMLMGRCFLDYTSFDSPDYKELKDDLQKYHIGSLVVAVHINQQGLVRPSPLDAARVTNQLQLDSKLPLLITADLERVDSLLDFKDICSFVGAGNYSFEHQAAGSPGVEVRGFFNRNWSILQSRSNTPHPAAMCVHPLPSERA